jgi:hypothetical protein
LFHFAALKTNRDMSAVKLPGEAEQNNLPPECGQPIDAGGYRAEEELRNPVFESWILDARICIQSRYPCLRFVYLRLFQGL